MKKYLTFTLIAIAIVGAYQLPIRIVSAQAAPDGICTVTNGRVQTTSRTKEAACYANVPRGNWVPLTTTTTTTTTSTTTNSETSEPYQLLAPIGGITSVPVAQNNALGQYLNLAIKLIIGISAVLATVMIVIGGIEYMTSELISSKEEGKKRITNAIFGLILALGAYLLLSTINPDLLKTDADTGIQGTTLILRDEPETGIPSRTITATGGRQLVACDATQIAPLTVFGHQIEGGVNKGVVASLQRIDALWRQRGGASFYPVTSIGGYNCREVTGKPGTYSAHAFGLALDINPSTNPYGASLKSDMPAEFRSFFISEGWGWGGNWNNVKDAMHFSKYPPQEGGNGTLE